MERSKDNASMSNNSSLNGDLPRLPTRTKNSSPNRGLSRLPTSPTCSLDSNSEMPPYLSDHSTSFSMSHNQTEDEPDRRQQPIKLLTPRTNTEVEAQWLLYNFTQEQLQRDSLSLPSDVFDEIALPSAVVGNLCEAGSELRRLADAFAKTEQRRRVECMANSIPMTQITWENFAFLCSKLFVAEDGVSVCFKGVTVERIVALFTFISDVAKAQLLRGALSCLPKLMSWALHFIIEHVCSWVRDAGGWGVLLHCGLDIVYKVAVSCASVVAIIAMSAYIAKTWRAA